MDSAGGNDDGHPSRTVSRSAIQWFRLQVDTGGLTYSAHGRTYDPTSVSTNAYWFHFPSLNVNAAGDALLGCSGSKATEYIGAFYQGRKADNWSRSYLLQAGRASWTSDRWGDYSATSMDPSDGSFWTVQEFSSQAYDVEGTNRVPYSIWGTWIGQVKVSP
jgi:hypothetical protein